ncbi:Lrp/AsnC family transcriptional regulator [Streptomyces sp. NBC_01525]|uniref:Lrp/AsnC family transcriptional regulator n=1 Tax=Streptomyces benahoarensis TaxID=2595054 RepID=A0A553ZP87_9ACTN|nr:Lrp/AsnC family transcriptional regulator [Streptomyces benahoarensis]TSB28365.1 Lrp/AsnC family transcriptional regulator [Streptomyces benahoarensis]TSB43284.1 Lrp/AsnC family transcriptional regulator [Streptomyces benahoarensis]
MLEEVDLALVDALQINPRASWTTLAEVLELAPITLARRWQRLTDDGAAWITVALGNSLSKGAIVEFSCAPGTATQVAERLAELPHVITVGVTTGEYEVFALIMAPSLAAISTVLLKTLPLPEQVTKVRSHVFGSTFGGIIWRLGVMNRSQADQVREAIGPLPRKIRPFGAADRALFLALGHDGRRRYASLADELNTTPPAVKRRLERLRRHGDITFRCDVARPLAGWPTMALLWLTVPDVEVQRIGNALGSWPETRHCAAVTSPANLGLIVGLRSLNHLDELLIKIAREHPDARVVDRRLVLQMTKVYGRILDEQGRSTRVVPVDPWTALST